MSERSDHIEGNAAAQGLGALIQTQVLAPCCELFRHLETDGYIDALEDELSMVRSAPDLSEPPEGYAVIEHDPDNHHGERCWVFDTPGDDWKPENGEFASERQAIAGAWHHWWEVHGEEPPRKESVERWLVTEALANRLAAKGEPVGKVLGQWMWGRTDCGELHHDATLQAIANQENGS
ncbi:hypothetical protein [Halomonas sp. I5-271120]|uniref:hypothetical protein n=1 Tax=Halomonas sp. I5-271120 TaxID=3061632 RepID=UPI002714A057|nr:hypothetical protein [Halomonas sp. I5-271120]